MADLKYTPGPWMVVEAPRSSSPGHYFAVMNMAVEVTICDDSSMTKADAALIACAPDLLEAVKRYEKSSSNQAGENNQVALNLRILIAKAEGK